MKKIVSVVYRGRLVSVTVPPKATKFQIAKATRDMLFGK
jgi:hypothetical protein